MLKSFPGNHEVHINECPAIEFSVTLLHNKMYDLLLAALELVLGLIIEAYCDPVTARRLKQMLTMAVLLVKFIRVAWAVYTEW